MIVKFILANLLSALKLQCMYTKRPKEMFCWYVLSLAFIQAQVQRCSVYNSTGLLRMLTYDAFTTRVLTNVTVYI